MNFEGLSRTIKGNKTGDRQIPTNFTNWEENRFEKLEVRVTLISAKILESFIYSFTFRKPNETMISRSQ